MRTIVSGRRAAAAVTMLAAMLTFAACGSEHNGGHTGDTTAPTTTAQPSATFNDADVAFATGMIPHHAQAVRMAELAATRTTNDKLLTLADTIKQAQQPEIDTMTGWLQAWGKPVPPLDGAGHGGHGDMPGMMSPEEMKALMATSGAGFDRMFVEMMIRHHEGAVTMAELERTNGANPAATALAAQIITAQQAEIVTMRGMLNR